MEPLSGLERGRGVDAAPGDHDIKVYAKRMGPVKFSWNQSNLLFTGGSAILTPGASLVRLPPTLPFLTSLPR